MDLWLDLLLLRVRQMSKARPVLPGATLFSTRRVHKRQLLLRPSPRVTHVIEYIVAVLAERYGIELHALCVMSNHMHDVSTDPHGNIVDFQRDCHALLTRHINAIFGDFESMWAREPTCRVECVGPDDIVDKMTYTITNPVEALLVDRGHHWPGVRRCWPAKLKTVPRPAGFFRGADDGGAWPDEAALRFHRPPGYDHLSDAELAELLSRATNDREERIRTTARGGGKQFLGRRAVLAQSRYAYPQSREERFGIRPTVAATSKWARIERLQGKKAWDLEYSDSLTSWRAGNRAAVFPYGTYKLRAYYNFACGPPPM